MMITTIVQKKVKCSTVLMVVSQNSDYYESKEK